MNSDGMVVRVAGPADAAAIAACHQVLFHGGWSIDSLSQMLGHETTRAWVVEHDGKIGGFLIAMCVADEMEILSIGVVPSDQRRGQARAMMTRLEEHAVAHGIRVVFLEVDVNNSKARALYEVFGYRRVGERRAYYTNADGSTSDALLLAKDIEPGRS